MNTRITFLLSFFCLTLLMSCGTENTTVESDTPVDSTTVDDTKKDEAATKLLDNAILSDEGEIHYNTTEDEKIMAMIRKQFLPELKANTRKEICSGDGAEIEISPIPFKPNDAVPAYIYAQIKFKRGDVIEDDFVLFYPDFTTGELAADSYVHITEDERPCNICDMTQIRRAPEKDPYGIFVDRQTTAVREMDMDYNLTEALIQWVERN